MDTTADVHSSGSWGGRSDVVPAAGAGAGVGGRHGPVVDGRLQDALAAGRLPCGRRPAPPLYVRTVGSKEAKMGVS